ncbi:MAG: prepilin peptidase [Deltaproteobacteria bacterium]|nr:prepilin peptidase [Deltaproteobacteria bacterium]MBW2421022.1 prepilin peptidase [Deltaproteobacteria bacterium]
MQESQRLRPGVVEGAYPERHDPVPGGWARALHGLTRSISRRRQSTPLASVVQEIERRGKALASTSSAGLTEVTAALRRRLAREELDDALMQDSFALVREVAGRVLETPHFDVQLMGGWVMAQGMLAEMETGEGKTLTATLPAATAALAGIPVHVISSNDYLVTRDAEAMGPIYEALGLTVGTITSAEKDPEARRAAYACDITYATSNQVAFDYLRDRIASQGSRGLAFQLDRLHREQPRSEQLLLRGLCFAIVDEADSVLIDEARTPLLLARQSDSSEREQIYKRALRLARRLKKGDDFQLDRPAHRLELTPDGRERLATLARPLGGFWSGPRRREEWVERGLTALHLFDRDHHYLVRDDGVQIIDPLTGRVSSDRSWDRGLHQLIELKEGCPLTPENETLARISYQQFFRRYLRLAGMTGTAQEVASELWSVYELDTVTIPTRLPSRRRTRPLCVYTTRARKWQAVLESIRRTQLEGQPILLGTGSVETSEQLSSLLAEEGLPHQVLNARQDAEEAQIVAEAGQPGRITVATNMAGRGTDIRLGPGVAGRGGLHVIATERAEARRIDRQLVGRCGRQGDPGSCEMLLSLEDERVAHFFPRGAQRILTALAGSEEILPPWLGSLLLSLPQIAEERKYGRMRRALMELEESLEDLLAYSGPRI